MLAIGSIFDDNSETWYDFNFLHDTYMAKNTNNSIAACLERLERNIEFTDCYAPCDVEKRLQTIVKAAKYVGPLTITQVHTWQKVCQIKRMADDAASTGMAWYAAKRLADEFIKTFQYDYTQSMGLNAAWLQSIVGSLLDPIPCFAFYVIKNTVYWIAGPELQLDGMKRLSSLNGPAFKLLDYVAYLVNGIAVPKWIIEEKGKINAAAIDKEQNVEVRRIMIEIIGWPRYIQTAKMEPLDERENDIEGTIEALYIMPDGSKMLVVNCPTGRVFAIQVHPSCETCQQAQNWLGAEELNASSRCLFRT